MPPLVDIIIPLYNSATTIGAALASLRAQTDPRWRALVIDDGSTDNGPALVRALAASDPRITLHAQPNAGVCAARNAGIDRASAPFLLFLDADDWLLPRALERLLPHASADPSSPRGSFGGFEFHSAAALHLADERSTFPAIGLHELLGLVFLTVHAHIIPRCALGRARFDPALPVVEDTDLWLRLAARGLTWTNCNALVAAYRLRPASRSFDFAAMLRASNAAYTRAFALPSSLTVDRSAARLARIHCSVALAYATRAALTGDLALAESLFTDAPGDKSLTAQQLSIMAWQAVLLGLTAHPADTDGRAAWQRRLDDWWSRIARHRWATPDAIARARAALDQRIDALRAPAPPRISTIIPLYQSAATIERTLASIPAAGEDAFEALIVNDGSTDAGPALAQDIAERDRRFRLIHQPNAGLAAARNAGISASRGPFLHFLDADDELAPRGLRTLLDTAGHTAGAHGPFAIHAPDNARIDTHQPPHGPLNLEAFLDGRFVVCHSMIIRRDALGPHRFDESWGRIEDYHLWLRLAAAGIQWARTPGAEPVCIYHLAPRSMSTGHADMAAQARRLYSQPFATHRGAPNPRLLRDAALTWSTRAALSPAPDALAAALAILDHLPADQPISPFAAAHAAADAVTLGLALPLTINGRAERAWAPALARFWSALEDLALAPAGFTRAATRALAQRTINDDAVVASILSLCDPARPLILIGLGKNGRRLAVAALARGLRTAARDDSPRPDASIDGLTLERIDAPITAAASVVITPTDDGALWPRFASPARRIIRWSLTAAALSEAAAAHLSRAMALSAPPATAGHTLSPR